jgi:CheY-like chemotaxis protein
VDDNKVNRLLLSAQRADAGPQRALAENGRIALEMLRR